MLHVGRALGVAGGLSLSIQTDPLMQSTAENLAEPRENSEAPRLLLQLHRPQQQGTPKSTYGPEPGPPEAHLR